MAEFTTPEEFEKELERARTQLEAGWISQKQYNDVVKDAKAGVQGYTANLRQSMAQLGTSFKALGKDIYDGKQGASTFNDTMSSGADAVANYAMKFGPAGVAFGLFTKAIVGYVNAANKQSDALYDTYKQISRAGVVGSQAMKGVYDDMQDFGYTQDKLGEMGAFLTRNSKSLANFGKSAVDGTAQLQALSGGIQNSDLRRQFFNLGEGVDDINEASLGYLNQLGRMGKATQATTQGAVEYNKEMETLTRLTGLQRADVESQRQALADIDSYNFTIRQLTNTNKSAADNIQSFMSQLDPEQAQGMAEIFGNVGIASGKMAMDIQQQTGFQVLDLRAKALAGEFSGPDGVNRMMKEYGAMVGKNIDFQGKQSTYNAQYGMGQAKAIATVNAMNKGFAETRKSVDDTADGLDATTNSASKLRDNQIKQAQNLQGFVNLGVAPATRAMEIFTDVIEELTSWLPGAGKAKKKREEKEAAAEAATIATQGVRVSGSAEAKASAEKYLGKAISDDEFSALIKATHAEAAGGKQASQQEQAMIMASVLNRARTATGGIMGALTAKNQFQSVTGTANAPGPSQNYLQGPEKERLQSIEGATQLLQNISTQQKNFTAASAAAYGPGTNIGYRDKMLANGGTTIGGSVFQTQMASNAEQVARQDISSIGKISGLSGPTTSYKPTVPPSSDSIPSANKLRDELGFSNNKDTPITVSQLDKMDEMISVLKNQLNVQTKLMQYSS